MAGAAKRDDRDGIFDTPTTPRLGDLLRVLIRNLRLDLRVAAPGKIVTYNAVTQKANIELQILPVYVDFDDILTGERVSDPLILVDIPVLWPRTATAHQTLPLAVGDTGLLVCNDRSIDTWIQVGFATDPYAFHTHNFADAVFFPGLHPDTNPISPPPSAVAHVIEGAQIDLGVGAVDFLIKGTALATALTPIIATLTAVPAATDPATVITAAVANKAAILAALSAIQSNLSAKTKTV